MYCTDPSVDVIVLTGDASHEEGRIVNAGVVPPLVWDAAKAIWDAVHDPDFKPKAAKKKATKKAGRLK